MSVPSFKTFLIKSKFNYNKASLYKEAYSKILDENLFNEEGIALLNVKLATAH